MRWTLVAGVVACGLLLLPGDARGATTIGSDLATDPVDGGPCSGSDACTATNTTLPGRQVSSPIDGVVVRWRLRYHSAAANTGRLKVIRSATGGEFTGIRASSSETIPSDSLTTITFLTQLPISAGDRIALDLDSGVVWGSLNAITNGQDNVTLDRWDPPLANGQTKAPETTISHPNGSEITFNADVEADADCDGLGDETQDPDVVAGGCDPPSASLPAAAGGLDAKKAKTNGKNFKLKFACPAGGGDCDDNAVTVKTAKKVKVSATAAAKKKKVTLGKATFSIPAGMAQKVKVKLTGKGKKLFKKQKKVKAKATVRTSGASPVSTSGKVTIKRK